MPKLYVVRHAQPEVTGVLLGRTDPPLSRRGRADAERVLSGIEAAVAYTSPLRRCRETAAAVRAQIVVLEDLSEIALGEWDGLSWPEIERRYPNQAHAKLANWFGVTPPGGEPWDAFAARVKGALEVILSGPLPAAVIGHVAANSVLAEALCGDRPESFDQAYCEIREFEVSRDG